MSKSNTLDEMLAKSPEELKNFRVTERVVDIEDAFKEYANELIPVLAAIGNMKARPLGRVLKAFLKMPVIKVDFEKELQGMEEHKLLVALIKATDTKMLLIEAMDDGGDDAA